MLTASTRYLADADSTPVSAIGEMPLPGPEVRWESDLTGAWSAGYIHQLEARQVSKPCLRSSATRISSTTHLDEGEERIGIAESVTPIDSADGISVRQGLDE